MIPDGVLYGLGGCFGGLASACLWSNLSSKSASDAGGSGSFLSASSSVRSLLRKGRSIGRPTSSPSEGSSSPTPSSGSNGLVPSELKTMAKKVKSILGSQAEEALPQKKSGSVDDDKEESWRGRMWSIALGPGEETTVEARFFNDGAHWWVSMQERGPGIQVTATLLSAGGEHVLEHDVGQSFHGMTPMCHGEALLRLHIQNQYARVSTRQVEVSMFLYRAGARIAEHSFVRGAMLDWMTGLINDTFILKDVKLKADRLTVVEVERIMHTGLWERYVKRRKQIAEQLSKESIADTRGAVTRVTDALTDSHVPLPLSEVANEHWLFHGTSAAAIFGISEGGFRDNSKVAHGLAFGAGTYFTECSSKADTYATPAEWRDSVDHRGLCCILLCRVTLGRARKLDSDFHIDKAALKSDVQSGHYHSVLADRQRLFNSYREFVTPAAQAYPEFIVWYQRDYKTALESWKERQWGGDLFG